jgi:hypothetical protein
LPSQGSPQMCRCAYGVPAYMIIVPASRMTVDSPVASASNGHAEHPVRTDGNQRARAVERVGVTVLYGTVEHVDQSR